MDCLKEKKKYTNEILILKSAFSTIDQMFRQDILNAEIIDKRWCGCSSNEKLTDPEKVNKFLYSLMYPFPEVPACDKDEHNNDSPIKDFHLNIKPGLLGSGKKCSERKGKRKCCIIS